VPFVPFAAYACERIERRNVGALESIAIETSQSNIGGGSLATMFKRDEMIGFVRKEGL
jgi:hypothetical protein